MDTPQGLFYSDRKIFLCLSRAKIPSHREFLQLYLCGKLLPLGFPTLVFQHLSSRQQQLLHFLMSHSSVWQYTHTLSAHSSPLTEHGRAGRNHTNILLTVGNQRRLPHSSCTHTRCTPGARSSAGWESRLGTPVTLLMGRGRYQHWPGDACAHRRESRFNPCSGVRPVTPKTPGGCDKPAGGDRDSTSPVTSPQE